METPETIRTSLQQGEWVYLSRFQGRLLPHTNTGTIQKISKISCSGPDLSVQGTALWSVHSAHGVHCVSEGSQTDGHAKGYKDPQYLDDWLVRARSQQHLSPTYPNPGEYVPDLRLAGKSGEIRTGNPNRSSTS